MSVKILTEVLDHAPSKGGELVYLIALADQANDDDRCAWPGVKTLTRRSRAGRSTVYEYAAAAQEKGVIERCPEDELPFRFRRNPGREAVVWRFRPVAEWGARVLVDAGCSESEIAGDGPGGNLREEGVQNLDGSSPPDPRGPARRTRTTTATTTAGKNNSLTTSKSSSTRRAKARRAEEDQMYDPARAVFEAADDGEEAAAAEAKAKHGPDSAWGLNKYYCDAVRTAGNGFLGNTNDKAMMNFFSKAKRQGVTPSVLRAMVDEFVSNDRLFTKASGGARWRVFIANAEGLRQRTAATSSVTRVGDFTDVPDFSGAIPQHILDEILDEAG